MKIPLGNFGLALPQTNGAPRVATPAPSTGLDKIAKLIGGYADEMYKNEAASQSATAIIGGKRRLDEWKDGLDASPIDEQGNQRYETAAQEFDKHFEAIKRDALTGTRNTAAQAAIDADLGTYYEHMRGKVLDTALKQRQDHAQALLMGELEAAKTTPGIEHEERLKRMGQVIGAMVVSGGMKMEDGVKLRQKEEATLEFSRVYDSIQQATTRERLFEVRGQVSAFNPRMSVEQNKGLVEMANARIRAIEDENAVAVKARQEDITKELDSKAKAGTLTLQEVESHKATLPPDTYRRMIAMPDINRAPVGAGSQAFVRDIERDTLKSYRDAKKLEGLRNRITDLMTGYDPVSQTYGERQLSADEGRRMLDNIEGYLRDIRSETRANRTEGRVQKNEKQDQQDSKMREAADLLKRMYDARGKHERTKAGEAEIETRYNKAYEDMLKHKDDPIGWLDQHKKTNPDVVNPPKHYPSWVIQSGNKPDGTATRKRLLEEKQAGRISAPEYQRRFDQLKGLEQP